LVFLISIFKAWELNLLFVGLTWLLYSCDDSYIFLTYSMGEICIDVLITCSGYKRAEAKKPTDAPFANLIIECFMIDSSELIVFID
jgi:hypothetical protein